jgi:predicted DNA-binding transcriptional regulator YafY
MSRPTTRVLSVLELLQTHGHISGSELAQKLEVDGRTVRRYIATLEEMGIPIVSERGRYGAYGLVAGFKLPPMMFTNDEALALSLGLLAARGLGLAENAPAVASARAKLERVLPADLKRRARAIDESVALDFTTPLTGADQHVLGVLSLAAQAQQRLRMKYRDANDSESERNFDPFGLGFRGGRWYVIGHCHLRRGMRSFRVDRIIDVHAIAASFLRPAGFDALDYLSKAIANLPRSTAVEIRIAAGLLDAQAQFPGGIGVFEPCADGVLLRARTDHIDWFARQLARLPFEVEILQPANLRVALRKHAQRLAGLASVVGRPKRRKR